MKSFDYLVADGIDPALRAYDADENLQLKAGGIDLIDLMNNRIAAPDAVLTIGGVDELAYIREEDDGVRIGCNTTLADLARSDLIASQFPGLHHAVAGAATPQVRERATLGGNLCQRPRCWYFRSRQFHCLKKHGHMCYAVEGENRYHAIFGDGPCHIVHPSNAAPPLVALDAAFVLRTRDNERTVASSDFFVMPDRALWTENVLEPGEILTEVYIPKAPSQSATIELREKQSYDWPLAICAVARLDGRWRVVLGAVAPVPWVSEPAMAVLGDRDITGALAAQAGEAAVEGAKPMRDNAYKLQLVKVAVKRALMTAAAMEVPQ